MKFAICNEIFQDWPLDKTMAFAAAAGYGAIELAPFTLAKYVTDISAEERKMVRGLAGRHGLAISGIHWVLAQTEGLHLTHPDRQIRENTRRYLSALVDFAADLGGRYMIVGSPKQRNIQEGVSRETAWEYATDAFRPTVMRAEQREITICFEPLSPAETNFINTAAEAIAFVQQLNTPHFKIILDVKAMSSEQKPIPEIIRSSWPHFAYFHANDKNLKGPGFGEVDFHPILEALLEVGYHDYISVEVFDFTEGAETIATRSLSYLQATLAAVRTRKP